MTAPTPRRKLADAGARGAIRDDLSHSFIVEAAAGTGKTTELVARIVNVLRRGLANIEQIAAVTFTEKAAGELKLRLREDLERARADAGPDDRPRLEHALQYLEEARVSTIHGFCADLLRERPVEARIDPAFVVLTEDQSLRLYDVAFDGWLQEQLASPGEGVRRSLRRPSRRTFGADEDEDGPVERLRRAGRALLDWRDHPAPWRRDPFDRKGAIDRLVAALHDFADLSTDPSWSGDPLALDTAGARARSAAIRDGLVAPGDYDGLEGLLVDLRQDRGFARPRKGGSSRYSKAQSRAEVWEARERLHEALVAFEAAANADLASLLREDLAGSLEAYERLKQAEGALDFVDLLLRARNLLRDDPAVRRTFRARLTHLFVDEFQDTDPLQAEILILLSGDPDADTDGEVRWRDVTPRPGSLFLVGDPKQSIYRFRRADVGVYQDVCDWLAARGARREWLTTSFRATPSIQRAVNAAFAPLMTRDSETLQPDYVPLAPFRDEMAGRPAVVALPVPRPYGRRAVTKTAIEQSLPDAVGAFVHWLVTGSGWRVTERDVAGAGTREVPVEPRHVCLLFRRFTTYGRDVTREYLEALEARDVPHLLVGGKSYHDREEVETLRAALTAVEWPDDELSVFAALRGALFAAGDEALLEYRHHFGRFHPFQVPDRLTGRLQPVGEALALLGDLHRRRNRRPVADTIAALLDATRAHVGFALRRGGEQALANVLQVVELARRYEAGGGLSFRGFVEELASAAARADAPEAPILEEGSEGVRLMTVHKAKGLEFPVVILVDMTARLSRDAADRHLDSDRDLCALRLAGWAPVELLEREALEVERDRAEGCRLAYVAATRARDLLVVPAVGDQPFADGWTSPLNGAVYPPVSERRTPGEAAGCPPFPRRDSVLERPDGDPARAETVSPGAHRMSVPAGDTQGGEYDVVWWDPGVLDLGRRSGFGMRRESLIARDAPPAVVEESLAAFTRWQADRDRAIAEASRPSRAVQTVSEWSAAPPPDALALPDAEVVTIEDGEARPSGVRYGALVHAVLASVPLDADEAGAAAVAALQGRILAAAADEIAAATRTAVRVLEHDLMKGARRAAARGACRREVPVMLADASGAIVEGIADLAYEDGGGWIVVDFKTDVEIGRQGLDRYRRQVGFYAAAVARATGVPARAALLRV